MASVGRCSKCNSEDIQYKVSYLDGDLTVYPYECQECGHVGNEYYSMQYTESD